MVLRSLFFVTVPLVFSSLSYSKSISDYVDPLIGTARSPTGVAKTLTDSGLTQPGPLVPFGMISMGPNTISDQDESIKDKYERDVGYNYDSHRIDGFTLTHLSGAGCPNGGELPFLPFKNEANGKPVFYSHEGEIASPGYYRVLLKNGMTVELTTKERTGFGRFTFQGLKKGTSYGLQFFHARHANPLEKNQKIKPSQFHFEDERHFSGSVVGGNFCQSTNLYRLYFAGEISQVGGKFKGDDKTGIIAFNANDDESAKIEFKIAISYVSLAGAKANLAVERMSEGKESTFDEVRTQAVTLWDAALSKIKIQSDDIHELRTFYTALYHSLISPNVQDDVNGLYRGYDQKVHAVPVGHRHYANYSGWDIYHSEVQLLSILFPKIASDMAQSLITAADECGALPNWALNHSDTAVMIGDSGPIMLSNFYAFGATQFDQKKALHYMIKSGTDPKSSCNGHPSRSALKAYLNKGYITADDTDFGFTSMSLEYALADFAVSRFARNLNQSTISQKFAKRSQNWKKLWWTPPGEKWGGFIRPKTSEGQWLEPFYPENNPVNMKDPHDPESFFDQGFVEGTSTQYSLMIPFDFAGVLKKMGNQTTILNRLDHFFENLAGGMNSPFMHIGNEPNFSTPWIYLWAGVPSRTQEVVRRILKTTFDDSVRGLPGNDDLGSTSTWYIFASLGFYPVVPGVGGLALHSPLFENAEINLENGNKIEIASLGSGPYVSSLSLNSEPLTGTWLDWGQLKEGAKLKFSLSQVQSDWGSGRKDLPPSFHD